MPDENISQNGVFYDTKNNKVVESQPEEGVQILAPGGEVTKAVEDDIQRYKDLEQGVVREPETVTTASVGRKPKADKPDDA